MPRIRPLDRGRSTLDSYIRRVLRTCERVEQGLARGSLLVTDVELVYSSGFLSIVTRWEAFLEDSLYESVCGVAPGKLVARRNVIVPSRSRLERILLHPNHEYIQLTTVKQAESLYDLFLKNSGPFGSVSAPNRTYLQQAIYIRNAIAHSSASATIRFRDGVPGVTALPSNRQTPGAFLRHIFRQSPSQRRLELYCAAFLSAAGEMNEGWAAAS